MFARVYAVRGVRQFLELHGKQDFLLSFTSEKFQLTLAYLVDIFESFNHMNLLLQGKNTNRMNDYNAIRACIAKLGCGSTEFKREIENETFFLSFDAALEKSINLKGQLSSELEIEFHLQ